MVPGAFWSDGYDIQRGGASVGRPSIERYSEACALHRGWEGGASGLHGWFAVSSLWEGGQKCDQNGLSRRSIVVAFISSEFHLTSNSLHKSCHTFLSSKRDPPIPLHSRFGLSRRCVHVLTQPEFCGSSQGKYYFLLKALRFGCLR